MIVVRPDIRKETNGLVIINRYESKAPRLFKRLLEQQSRLPNFADTLAEDINSEEVTLETPPSPVDTTSPPSPPLPDPLGINNLETALPEITIDQVSILGTPITLSLIHI